MKNLIRVKKIYLKVNSSLRGTFDTTILKTDGLKWKMAKRKPNTILSITLPAFDGHYILILGLSSSTGSIRTGMIGTGMVSRICLGSICHRRKPSTSKRMGRRRRKRIRCSMGKHCRPMDTLKERKQKR